MASLSVRGHLVVLALAAMMPLAALEAWEVYRGFAVEGRAARERVLHLAEASAQSTAKYVEGLSRMLAGLAQRPAIRALDPQRCDAVLADLLALSPGLANAATMKLDGTVVCSAVPMAKPVRMKTAMLLDRLRPGDVTVGSVTPGTVTGRWAIPVGVLTGEAGGEVGAVGVAIDLERLAPLLNMERLSPRAVASLAAADGTVLARSTEAGKFVGTRAAMGFPSVRQRHGTAVTPGLDGVMRVVGFAPVAGTDWVATVSLPFDEVYAQARRAMAESAVVALAVLLGAGGLVAAQSRRIRAPLAALSDVAERAAEDPSVRARVDGPREIARIGIEMNRMLERRASVERELHGLAQRLIEVEEASRKSFNRELHDRVGASLSAANLMLEAARADALAREPERAEARIEEVQAILLEAAADARDLMAQLAPPGLEEYGLLAALRARAAALRAREGLEIDVAGEEPSPRLPAASELALYRIADEALSNVSKHSGVRAARVELRAARDEVVLEVADAGSGYLPAARAGKGWGLGTMRERALAAGAQLESESAPGVGTRVRVRLPWGAS